MAFLECPSRRSECRLFGARARALHLAPHRYDSFPLPPKLVYSFGHYALVSNARELIMFLSYLLGFPSRRLECRFFGARARLLKGVAPSVATEL